MIEFLVAKKESVRICGIAILDRSTTIGHWVKRVMGSKMGKAELHDFSLLRLCGTNISLKILQHADAITDES